MSKREIEVIHCISRLGVQDRNDERHVEVDVTKGMEMAVVNTFFQKREWVTALPPSLCGICKMFFGHKKS